MTTFLPYASFEQSAKVLDPVRRWKQVVECFQIIKVLETPPPPITVKKVGWRNHPAILMWQGFVPALKLYTNHMLLKVISSGSHRVVAYQPFDLRTDSERKPPMPPWFGSKKLHSSHRSKLYYKDTEFYGQYGWKEASMEPLEYVWPVTKGDLK